MFFDFCRLIGAAFLIHFSTHGLDVYLSQDWEEMRGIAFESTRAALLIAVLLIFRMTWVRGYCVLADGSSFGGGCSWGVFLVGISCFSLSQDFSYFPWFAWYSGSLPWGLIWPIALALGIWVSWEDYKLVPMEAKSMRSSLFKIVEALDDGVEATQSRAEELASLADDLNDALRISNDPVVVSLVQCGPDFLKLKEALQRLMELDLSDLTESEFKLIEQDLKIMRADLKALLERFRSLGSSSFSVESLRVSSFLLTRGR